MRLVSRLLVIAGSLPNALTAPTSTQDVLSAHPSIQTSEQPIIGVGFDLAASYGSAAVSFSNGTIVTIAQITGGDGYNEVFQRLSLDSSTHPSPPYDNLGEVWYDMPRQDLRKLRKAIGLPASSDVGFLGGMLSELRARVEERVGSIISAGVTTPHLVALYDQDLHDAFEYLALEKVAFPVGYPGHHMLYQTSAAYAGYGFGLCPSYEDPVACRNEECDMSPITVMAILYTRTALTVSLSIVASAYLLWEPSYRHLIDSELGYDAKDELNKKGYWGDVKIRLEQIMIENPGYDRPAKALGDQMEILPEIFSSPSEVVAARGVAELAKRVSFKSSEI